MKKTIIFMLVLVLAVSMFVFTACDDKDGGNNGVNDQAIVFSENMTYEEALAAVQADSEFVGFTYYLESYDEDGKLVHVGTEKEYYNNSYIYYSLSDYDPIDDLNYVDIKICDFKEGKNYYIIAWGTGEIECFFDLMDKEGADEFKEEILENRNEAIKYFYDNLESGIICNSNCEASENGDSHCSAKIEGTSLTFICDCGKCKDGYKDFNASFSLPEEYDYYKSIAVDYDAD